MPPTSPQGTSAHRVPTVRSLDTRRDQTSSSFLRFKRWSESAGYGFQVIPTEQARRTGRHLCHMRTLGGEESVLGMSTVEDPSLIRFSAEHSAGTHLFLIVSGGGIHYIPTSGASVSPSAGSLLVSNAVAEHEVEVRERTWRMALQVPATALKLTADEVERVLAHEVRWQAWQASLLMNLAKGFLSEGMAAASASAHDLDRLYAGIAEFIIRSGLGENRESSAAALRRVRAREYIALHVADKDLGPRAVAAHQGVTVRQLARCFAVEGTTISAEIKRIRLEHAKDQLLARAAGKVKVSITDVASLHGFSSLAHFSRSFAEAYGLPPSELTG